MTSVEEFLIEMNHALRTGQFEQLERLQSQMESIADDVRETDPTALGRIRDLAQRSTRLLSSARLGLQEAKRQHQDIMNPNRRFVVYHPDGRKRDLLIGGGITIRG